MIQGIKINLRAMGIDDSDFMLDLLNDFETSYYEGKNEFLITKKEQTNWLEHKNKDDINYIIYDNNNNKIGYFSFKYTNKVSKVGRIGIKLHKDYRGKGFAKDALCTMTSYLFLIFNIHKLETHIIEYNNPSLKLFEKSNWTIEGKLRKTIYMSGSYYDNILLGLLKDEFFTNNNSEYIKLFKIED